jgi:hypothetical protein
MNLVDFYLGVAPDYQGRMLRDIWTWDYTRLEEVHDYIQVLFPLPEPSMFSSRAPILTNAEIGEFRKSQTLRENLLHSLRLMLDFYGLDYQDNPVQVRKAPHFVQRAANWLILGDHNYLRITRILKCLRICGLDEQARAFLSCLLKVREENPREIGEETLAYWKNAVDLDRGDKERTVG